MAPSILTFALAELNTLKYVGILSRGGVLSKEFVIHFLGPWKPRDLDKVW